MSCRITNVRLTKSHRRFAKLAIMNDSDNTGESSVSSIDWIEISN